MTKIKLKEQPIGSETTGTYPDVDETGTPFNRLSFSFTDRSGEKQYYQLNKADSADILIESTDGTYVEEEDVTYLVEAFKVDEYVTRLSFAWRPAQETIDIPSEWWEDVTIVPKNSAMFDEVYVNKEIIKIDYAAGVENPEKKEMQELTNKVNEKFPNEVDFYDHPYNIIGKYVDNHTIRPPYKSNNTITVYHMYYQKSWFQELLSEYKCPDYNYKYCFWFGFKYDLDSNERYFKVVIRDNDVSSNYQTNPGSFIPRPQLPHCNEPYFAKIYSEDGTEADEYDVFFSTTPEIMKSYCEEKGINYPIPEDKESDWIWTYGLVYDKNTLEIKQVKGYIKKAQDASDWVV